LNNKDRDILAFRNILASMGTEMNIEEAKKAYEASKKIMKRSRSMSMLDLWEIEGMKEVPMKDRQQALDLYRKAKEL
jgi:hypothetical protein